MTTLALQARPDPACHHALEDAFRGALRAFRGKLSNRAARSVSARFVGVETATFDEVIEPLRSMGTVIALTDVAGARGSRGCVILQGSLISGVLSLMLGESQADAALSADARTTTPLDLKVARTIVDDFVAAVAEGAERPELGLTTTSLGPLGISGLPIAPSSLVLEVSIELGLEEAPLGTLTLALPAELASKLAPRRRGRGHGPSPERVMGVQLDVVCELGTIHTDLAAVRKLELGSVLDLGGMPAVQVKVGGQVAMVGEAGASDGRRCVRIVRRGEAAAAS